MKTITIIAILLLSIIHLYGQGEIDTEKKILFRNEKTFGISLNSDGYGTGYRIGKRMNIHRKFLYDGDINFVKHQKEKKFYNPYSASLRKFVYGKTNNAFNIRFGIGQEHELFRKFDKNSVSVRWFYTGGISGMFLIPIYYQILDANNLDVYHWQLFEIGTQPIYILDKKPFTYALGETKIIPGGYIKTGFGFEFSKEDKRINLLEAGISLEVYPYPVKIMETEQNQLLFPVVYLSYRFGKAVSGYYLKELDEAN